MNPTTTTTSSILFFLLSSLLIGALCSSPGHGVQVSQPNLLLLDMGLQSKVWKWREKSTRRLMIGSIAPTCTYNECRGCRSKCTAEQVPVDANDPMNTAYHYKCVCHR
ncbi:EPIDERMAL PATTERNING FACTOR-like protein 9 [Ananas comosus]|uniref:EPIDERMAL PATTERNING FACTOR-like protein 9 n=1 Tax=Ananas comosus TaxID=4615 RepID=A0A6P5EGK3_ANACO|nr:EPIDERMAL PATTERNING FACTOR-like protein 9 [Ananas comosus]